MCIVVSVFLNIDLVWLGFFFIGVSTFVGNLRGARGGVRGGARGVMAIVARYGHGDTSSNPGPD